MSLATSVQSPQDSQPSHLWRRLQQDSQAPEATAEGPSAATGTLLTGSTLSEVLNSRGVLFSEICASVPETSGELPDAGLTCNVPDVVADNVLQHLYVLALPTPSDDQDDFFIEITLTSLIGNVDLEVGHRTAEGGQEIIGSSHTAAIDRVYIAAADVAQDTLAVTVVVRVSSSLATYSLSVEVEPGGRKLAAEQLSALRAVVNACCSPGTCNEEWEDVRAQSTTNNTGNAVVEIEVCQTARNHCDADGNLVRLALDSSGFQCTVADLNPLRRLPNLNTLSIQLADGITGSVNDLLAIFDAGALMHFEAFNVSLSGELPDSCTSGSTLDRLQSLALINAPDVTGSMPACLLGVVALDLHSVGLDGPFPTLPVNTPIERLVYTQGDMPGVSMSADGLDLSGAANLTTVILAALPEFSGAITLAPALSIVSVLDVPFTSIAGDIPSGLLSAQFSGTGLSGTVPKALLEGDTLETLLLNDNAFTAVPEDWNAPSLLILNLANNAIEGPLPAVLAAQSNLAALLVAGNSFSGSVDDFAEQLASGAEASKLHIVDISDNMLSGSLEGLQRLGVFTSLPFFNIPNFLNVSYNDFSGSLSEEMLQLSLMQSNAIVLVQVDVSGNSDINCPDPLTFNPFVTVICDDFISQGDPPHSMSDVEKEDGGDSSASERGGGGGGGSALTDAAAAGVAFAVIVPVALIVLGVLWWKRRSAKKRNEGSFERYHDTAVASLPEDANTVDHVHPTVAVDVDQ